MARKKQLVTPENYARVHRYLDKKLRDDRLTATQRAKAAFRRLNAPMDEGVEQPGSDVEVLEQWVDDNVDKADRSRLAAAIRQRRYADSANSVTLALPGDLHARLGAWQEARGLNTRAEALAALLEAVENPPAPAPATEPAAESISQPESVTPEPTPAEPTPLEEQPQAVEQDATEPRATAEAPAENQAPTTQPEAAPPAQAAETPAVETDTQASAPSESADEASETADDAMQTVPDSQPERPAPPPVIAPEPAPAPSVKPPVIRTQELDQPSFSLDPHRNLPPDLDSAMAHMDRDAMNRRLRLVLAAVVTAVGIIGVVVAYLWTTDNTQPSMADKEPQHAAQNAQPTAPEIAKTADNDDHLAKLEPMAPEEPTEIAPLTPPPTAAMTPDLRQARKAEIAKLLQQADEDVQAMRLTKPEGNNALTRYRRVLFLSPGNDQAQAGLTRIVSSYLALARKSAAKGQQNQAQEFLQLAGSIAPDSADVAAAWAELAAK
ncbi:hypothetical protein [Magnetofaba australis]|nr:hypothetical protein [Magnetofaba australis]